MEFSSQNPKATIVIIAGDRDYSYLVSRLRHAQHCVIIITPANGSDTIAALASVVLQWKDVLKLDPNGKEGARVGPAARVPQAAPEFRKDPDLPEEHSEEFNTEDASFPCLDASQNAADGRGSAPTWTFVPKPPKGNVESLYDSMPSEVSIDGVLHELYTSHGMGNRTSPHYYDGSRARRVSSDIRSDSGIDSGAICEAGRFDTLIKILNCFASDGEPRPPKEEVVNSLKESFDHTWKPEEYIQKAKDQEIIDVGVDHGSANESWLGLRPAFRAKDKVF
jgi:hypothetical protein